MRGWLNNWVVLITLGMLVQIFFPGISQAVIFDDLNQHWAQIPVEDMAQQGYIKGYPDGGFHPDQVVSRAEFTAFLNRIILSFPIQVPVAPNNGFTDVNSSDWFYSDITQLARIGVIHGSADGSFYPLSPIQRQEAALMVWTWMYQTGPPDYDFKTNDNFIDQDQMFAGAQPAITSLNQLKVLTGFPDGSFRPSQPLTRAEAAVMLCRSLNLVKKWNEEIIPVVQPAPPAKPKSESSHNTSSSIISPIIVNDPALNVSNRLHSRIRVVD